MYTKSKVQFKGEKWFARMFQINLLPTVLPEFSLFQILAALCYRPDDLVEQSAFKRHKVNQSACFLMHTTEKSWPSIYLLSVPYSLINEMSPRTRVNINSD